ncbi:hypothetical protein U9M48_014137, partial [Paspalum notatum var. saurae]
SESAVLWSGHLLRQSWQRHLALQHAHRLLDGRPEATVGMSAREADDHHPLHLRAVEVAAHPLVDRFKNGSPSIQAPHPLHEARLALVLLLLVEHHHGWAAAGDLEEHDAEAVHVRFRARAAGDEALRVHVAHRPREVGRVGAAAVVDEPREAEVAQLGTEGRVEHDVAWLHVPVHHALLPLLVKISKNIFGDNGILILYIIISYYYYLTGHLPALVAPSNELHKVPVPQPADDLDLRGVLLPPLLRTPGDPLDGNEEIQLFQKSSVNCAEAAFAKLLLLREAFGRGEELAVLEPLGP